MYNLCLLLACSLAGTLYAGILVFISDKWHGVLWTHLMIKAVCPASEYRASGAQRLLAKCSPRHWVLGGLTWQPRHTVTLQIFDIPLLSLTSSPPPPLCISHFTLLFLPHVHL